MILIRICWIHYYASEATSVKQSRLMKHAFLPRGQTVCGHPNLLYQVVWLLIPIGFEELIFQT